MVCAQAMKRVYLNVLLLLALLVSGCSTIQYTVEADGIATLMLDLPGKSMNVLCDELISDLSACIEKVAGDDKIKGAIRTDFILSAEIVVITLGTVAAATFGIRVAVLVGIGQCTQAERVEQENECA